MTPAEADAHRIQFRSGSILMGMRVVSAESGRLAVRNTMLQDGVLRTVLDLEPLEGWDQPSHGDIVFAEENA